MFDVDQLDCVFDIKGNGDDVISVEIAVEDPGRNGVAIQTNQEIKAVSYTHLPDGASDTLGHISKTVGLNVPNMAKIGLGNIPREVPLKTVPAESNPTCLLYTSRCV